MSLTHRKESLALQLLQFDLSIHEQFLKELESFDKLLDSSLASKQTHYHKLDEWSKPIYGFLQTMLSKHNFISGNVEHNDKCSACLWWTIYCIVGAITNSEYIINEECSLHHGSAWNRNQALQREINALICHLQQLVLEQLSSKTP